jgi:hypothetical protein
MYQKKVARHTSLAGSRVTYFKALVHDCQMLCGTVTAKEEDVHNFYITN